MGRRPGSRRRGGDLEAAAAAADRAVELALHANAPAMLADSLNTRAAIHFYLGAVDAAESTWSEALATAERWDLLPQRAMILNNHGEIAAARGDRERAVSLLSRADAMGRFLESDEPVADANRILAEVHLTAGDSGEAERFARAALAAATRLESPRFLAQTHQVLARVLEAAPQRDLDAIRAHLDDSVRAFVAAGMEADAQATRDLAASLLG